MELMHFSFAMTVEKEDFYIITPVVYKAKSRIQIYTSLVTTHVEKYQFNIMRSS